MHCTCMYRVHGFAMLSPAGWSPTALITAWPATWPYLSWLLSIYCWHHQLFCLLSIVYQFCWRKGIPVIRQINKNLLLLHTTCDSSAACTQCFNSMDRSRKLILMLHLILTITSMDKCSIGRLSQLWFKRQNNEFGGEWRQSLIRWHTQSTPVNSFLLQCRQTDKEKFLILSTCQF